MSKKPESRELLVLVFALFGGDADVTRRVLASAGIESEVCANIEDVCTSMMRGAGALILAEEALVASAAARLTTCLATQEPWSDLPIIVSASERLGERAGFGLLAALGEQGNVTILERPIRLRAMISAVQTALRARRRQYATRGLIVDLASSEARFREVQERAPYGLMLFDPMRDAAGAVNDFRWTYVNDVAAKSMRRPSTEIVGRCMLDLMPGMRTEGQFAIDLDAFENDRTTTREFFYAHDGFDAAYRVTSFRLEEKLAVVFEDITERKRAEEERIKLLGNEREAREYAEATNRSKDEFLANVSHELRTPLNAMLGWARMMTSGRLDPSKQQRALEAVERNAVAQAQLVDDLLDVSRITSGKLRLDLREVDLPKLVEAAVESVRPALDAKEIRFVAIIDPSTSQVNGDPNRLQQVIWNLLSNAIKFTPKGGRVDLTLTRVHSHIELSVSDNGQGFDPEFAPLLFQRFRQADGGSTRRQGGLGLGLAICRHLVELHGGTIEAASDGPNRGSLFRVHLPVLAVRLSTSATPTRTPAPLDRHVLFEQPAELRGLSILIVDDQPDARELLASVLSECGAAVIETSSAAEAFAALVASKPDVLISDIGMPGEDGYSLIRKVRALPADRGGRTPAAALTAFARAEDRRQALDAGFEMHIPKPIEPAELVSVLATLARIGKAMG